MTRIAPGPKARKGRGARKSGIGRGYHHGTPDVEERAIERRERQQARKEAIAGMQSWPRAAYTGSMEDSCRCGHRGEGPHPCHAKGYTCRKPATQRFYNAQPAVLAGVQMKLTCSSTWACDACWEWFKGLQARPRCEDCGTQEGVTEGPCPYAEDVCNKTVNVALCAGCRTERLRDI